MPADGFISLSRRNQPRPRVRVTRFSGWEHEVNPWRERPENHVILDGGLLAELIWNEEACVIEDFALDPGDPSEPYLRGIRSLAVIPLFDRSQSLNMVVQLSRQPRGAFRREHLPERVWLTNLFGRATQNLVLSDELKRAYDALDKELKVVADMQVALLPRELPEIPGLKLAAHYQTSRRAGGDYYDFFELPDGKVGILIADVSGHGTPAAVMMAVTHSIAHTLNGHPTPPSRLLAFVNEHLTARYTLATGTFVTAFYGIYEPRTRQLTYACAGHCPPRVKRLDRGRVIALDGSLSLPLGIDPDEAYRDVTETLEPGDALVLYTDGITEARAAGRSTPSDELNLFGTDRLDDVLNGCSCDAGSLIESTLEAVESFTGGAAPTDDRTLLVAKLE
jgi:sigma-B regulation protein RsbU (phosphoserine phosphatase)